MSWAEVKRINGDFTVRSLDQLIVYRSGIHLNKEDDIYKRVDLAEQRINSDTSTPLNTKMEQLQAAVLSAIGNISSGSMSEIGSGTYTIYNETPLEIEAEKGKLILATSSNPTNLVVYGNPNVNGDVRMWYKDNQNVWHLEVDFDGYGAVWNSSSSGIVVSYAALA